MEEVEIAQSSSKDVTLRDMKPMQDVCNRENFQACHLIFHILADHVNQWVSNQQLQSLQLWLFMILIQVLIQVLCIVFLFSRRDTGSRW